MPDSDKTNWWDVYSNKLVPGYAEVIAAEDSAVHMCSIGSVINGLLQTEAYAKVILSGPVTVDSDTLLEVRMKRQWHIFEKASPPKLEVVLDEACLYRELGSREILLEQLRHLLSMGKQPTISIRVLPFSEPQNLIMYDRYIYFFDERKTKGVVQFETNFGMYGQQDYTTLVMYYNQFVRIRDRALSEEETRSTIQQAIVRFES